MKNKLIADINNYIDYLNQLGFSVTVHGKYASSFLIHNIHSNPFCTLVKTDPQAWQKCIACQRKVFKEYKKGLIFGMCHAGVEEYVYFVNDKLFISVSGYGIHRAKALPRINRLSAEYVLSKEAMLEVYDSSLKHESEDETYLSLLINPLRHMLTLLDIWIADTQESHNIAFDAMLAYVHANYMKDISISDVAQACGYSESSVSHLFREYCNESVKKYINTLRINQAKRLLDTSTLSISRIAALCGFANSNYFPTAFKKEAGISPTEYRQRTGRL